MVGRVWLRHSHRGRPLNAAVRHQRSRGMRTVYTYALICCALLVANACVAYVWWHHVGGWAAKAEPSATVAATIEASHDIEQLRTMATILAKGRSQLAHDAEALA